MKNNVLGALGLAFMLFPFCLFLGFAFYPMILCILGACAAFYALLTAIENKK